MQVQDIGYVLDRLCRAYSHQWSSGERDMYSELLEKIPPLTNAELEDAVDGIIATRRTLPNPAVVRQMLWMTKTDSTDLQCNPLVEWERIRAKWYWIIRNEEGRAIQTAPEPEEIGHDCAPAEDSPARLDFTRFARMSYPNIDELELFARTLPLFLTQFRPDQIPLSAYQGLSSLVPHKCRGDFQKLSGKWAGQDVSATLDNEVRRNLMDRCRTLLGAGNYTESFDVWNDGA